MRISLSALGALIGVSPAFATIPETALITHAAPSDSGGAYSSSGRVLGANGRFVAFASQAANLTAGRPDSTNDLDVFVHDRQAGETRRVSHAFGAPDQDAAGVSRLRDSSDDGEWLLVGSDAGNLLAPGLDRNNRSDLFLYHLPSQRFHPVSRAASNPEQTASMGAQSGILSADGNWVAFQSVSPDLLPEAQDLDLAPFFGQIFLFERATGQVQLVSHRHDDSLRGTEGSHELVNISADGRRVLFRSRATSLVSTPTLTSGLSEERLYLFDRDTGSNRLLTPSAVSGGIESDGEMVHAHMSADGSTVVFSDTSTDLVLGFQNPSGALTAYAYRVELDLITPLATAFDDPNQPSNGGSWPVATSYDGRYTLIESTSTNLQASIVDSNSEQDVFLHDALSGELRIISTTAADPNRAANEGSKAQAFSANGRLVGLVSNATDLVDGQVDTLYSEDLFLFDTLSGTRRIVSRRSDNLSETASGEHYFHNISADGTHVAFNSTSALIADGALDTNGQRDVFLMDADTGAVTLISRAAPGHQVTANGSSRDAIISGNGQRVLFQSQATNLGNAEPDTNGGLDVFLADRSSSGTTLLSRRAGGGTGDEPAYARALNFDGSVALFDSASDKFLDGIYDGNLRQDVFLWSEASGTLTLVSRTALDPNRTGSGYSIGVDLSSDGRFALFDGTSRNLVPGVSDTNSTDDVFLFDSQTGSTQLVSSINGLGTSPGNAASYAHSVLRDASGVLFVTHANNLVDGVTDLNGEADAYLWDRENPGLTLLSRSLGQETVTANRGSLPVDASHDGTWILLRSLATDLVPGVVDENAADDVFLFNRTSGTTILVSRAADNPAATANGRSEARAVSADGRYVLFDSVADDLVAGLVDENNALDVFLFDRTDGSVRCISLSAHGAGTASQESYSVGLSDDANYIAFESTSSDLAVGVSDRNQLNDLFVYDVARAEVTLLSRSMWSGARTTSEGAGGLALSADGSTAVFTSRAHDLVQGVADGNQDRDLFWSFILPSRGVHRSGFEADAAGSAPSPR